MNSKLPETRLRAINLEQRDQARRDALACDVVAEECAEILALLDQLGKAANRISDPSLAGMVSRCATAAEVELGPLADYAREHGAGEWYG